MQCEKFFSVKLILHKRHSLTRIRFTSARRFISYIFCVLFYLLFYSFNFYSLLLTAFSQRTILAVPKYNMFPKVTCSPLFETTDIFGNEIQSVDRIFHSRISGTNTTMFTVLLPNSENLAYRSIHYWISQRGKSSCKIFAALYKA